MDSGNLSAEGPDIGQPVEWLIPRDRSSFYLTHDFHAYFAAYPPELVSRLLKKYSQEGETLLDPFMGGGTAIVEGFVGRRRTIGVDISPFSRLMASVKVRPQEVDEARLAEILRTVGEDLASHRAQGYRHFSYHIPPVTSIDRWFARDVQRDLAIILAHIRSVSDDDLRDFLLLGLSSILRKVSNAKNTEAHLCTKKGKKIPDAYGLFVKKISLMASQRNQYVAMLGDLAGYYTPRLLVQDVRRLREVVEPGSIDIVITSPPYGTGSRYTEINRLSFEWLELEKPARSAALETARDFREGLKEALGEIYQALDNRKYCFLVYGDPSTEGGLTRSAIEDAAQIGFEYEGLIACPIEKVAADHHEKYRRFIPKDFILILKKP